MTKGRYAKTITELEANAVHWWPSFLSDLETTASIIPLLIETQDKFLSLLTLADGNVEKVFELIESADFPPNLFLKHLVVLSDFGGEQIQRLNRQFNSVFPRENRENKFTYSWEGQNYEYHFKALPVARNLNNKVLGIDGKSLPSTQALDDLKKDLVAILLFGANCLNEPTAEKLLKCEIGNLLGKKEELEKYVKQKYIWVSRITGGAQANTLGQVAQTYVVDYLKTKLDSRYKVARNGSVKITRNLTLPFDVVVTKAGKSVGVEITFQVTTNSTIERKSGQAKFRYEKMHSSGNFITYIIDGAGNFQRKSAISEICQHSDCTVAYSTDEFDALVSFIKEVL